MARTFTLPMLRLRTARQAVTTGLALVGVVVLAATLISSTSAQAAPTAYGIWPTATVPRHDADADSSSVELGVRFRSSTDGWITGIRYYKSAVNTGVHVGTLWSVSGDALARTTFTSETTSGWQKARFDAPVRVAKGATYVASYRAPNGRYAADGDRLSPEKPITNYALMATQGVYNYGSGMPKDSWQDANYYVDVDFTTVNPSPSASNTPTTTRPPTSTTPVPTGACATSQVWRNLVACGWPGPGNTGYPPRQVFAKTVTGGLIITADNAVIDGWKVSGGIQVRAQNVTIQNSWVTNDTEGKSGTGVININPGYSATVEHSLLDGLNATHTCLWHEGRSMTARANNCQNVNDGIFMWSTRVGVDGTGDSFDIQENYLHAFTTAAANGHVDGIQTEGAKHGVIRHNTIDVAQDQTSAIAIWNGRKSADDIAIDRNLITGGGFSVYAEDYSPSEANPAGGYSVTRVTFTNNVFSTVRYGCVGKWGVWFPRGAPSDGWRRSGNAVLESQQNVDRGNPVSGGRVCN